MTDKEEGAKALMVTAYKHPTVTLSVVAGLVSGAVVGTIAWITVQRDVSDISKATIEQKAAIIEMQNRINDVERRSSDKMDLVQRDIGEVKASIRGIEGMLKLMVPRRSND